MYIEKLQATSQPSKLSSIMDTTYSDLLHKDSNTTEIILVRHGQTEWNLIHKLQGQGNSELTTVGKSGAIKVGKKLYWLHKNSRKIDFMYSSPLKRAQQTAKFIMEQFPKKDKLKINYDQRLMERHFGDLQGKTMSEIKQSQPQIYDKLHTNISYKPPGNNSETFMDVTSRSIQFLAQIASIHHGKCVLIVSHGGVLQAILTDILLHSTIPDRRFHCKNCAINIIQRNPENGKWYLSVLGDDEYGNFQNKSDKYQTFGYRTSSDQHTVNTFQRLDLTSLCVGVAIGCVLGYNALKWGR